MERDIVIGLNPSTVDLISVTLPMPVILPLDVPLFSNPSALLVQTTIVVELQLVILPLTTVPEVVSSHLLIVPELATVVKPTLALHLLEDVLSLTEVPVLQLTVNGLFGLLGLLALQLVVVELLPKPEPRTLLNEMVELVPELHLKLFLATPNVVKSIVS